MPRMAILIGQCEGSGVEQPPNANGTEVVCCNHSWKLQLFLLSTLGHTHS